MRLLQCLASRPGEVVSIDVLLREVWSDVIVSPDSAYQAVASLRRILGDDSKQPAYIATVPRLGYRLVAAVSSCADDKEKLAAEEQPPVHTRRRFPQRIGLLPVGAVVVLLLMGVTTWAFLARTGNGHQPSAPAAAQLPRKSIAVLPFLDLTEGMKEEEFADGMTEELIDRLSKIANLHVTPPTSSFYFKGKQVPVSDIARILGVTYVLDGSVRKSGSTIRVAARLIRADNGFIVWAETYDRPFKDILMVQDDIAGQVAKALSASIEPVLNGDAPQPR